MFGSTTVVAQSMPPSYGQPLRVMSDTPEYCAQLITRFAHAKETRPSVPADSLMLASEGERMCAMGHIRAGIARLRMAFYSMRAQ
jgi:hypothetical protein